MVEQGVYTLELFCQRRDKLTASLDLITEKQEAIIATLEKLNAGANVQADLIPQTERLLASYDDMTNQERNDILKTILYRIEYTKEADGKIIIDLFPRLPKI